jgi:hypothetical protein
VLLQGEDGKHYHFCEERFSDVCLFQWSFLDFEKKPSLGTLPNFWGVIPQSLTPAPGASRGVRQASRGCLLTVWRFSVNFDQL